MLLPARELKNFSHFEINFKSKEVKYRTVGFDEIIIHYSKPGWFGLRRWNRKFEFDRGFEGSDGDGQTTWKMSASCIEFYDQLQKITHNQWKKIPEEAYEKFIETFPEYSL